MQCCVIIILAEPQLTDLSGSDTTSGKPTLVPTPKLEATASLIAIPQDRLCTRPGSRVRSFSFSPRTRSPGYGPPRSGL